jgi:hypothetical protein
LCASRTSNAIYQRQEQQFAIAEVGCASAAGAIKRDGVLPIGCGRSSIEMDRRSRNSPNLIVGAIGLALNDKLFCDSQQRQEQINVNVVVCQMADIDKC